MLGGSRSRSKTCCRAHAAFGTKGALGSRRQKRGGRRRASGRAGIRRVCCEQIPNAELACCPKSHGLGLSNLNLDRSLLRAPAERGTTRGAVPAPCLGPRGLLKKTAGATHRHSCPSNDRTDISAICFMKGICSSGTSEAMSRPTSANCFQGECRIFSSPRIASAEIAHCRAQK
jgi:hypothetical protein